MLEPHFRRIIDQLQADLDDAVDDQDRERIELIQRQIRTYKRRMLACQD